MAQIIEKRIQWNSLKTYKFTVNYKAFQPEASNLKLLLLRQLSQKTQLISFKVKHSLAFNGPGISAAKLFVSWGVGGVPFTDPRAQIGDIDVFVSANKNYGLFQTMPQFYFSPLPANIPLIFNNEGATDIFISMLLGAGESIDNLNQGDFEIWLTTLRNV